MRSVAAKRPRKVQYFNGSSIVPQEFPPIPNLGKKRKGGPTGVSAEGFPYSYARLTKKRKLYSIEATKIRAKLYSLRIDKKKTATIMAFCKNWFIKKRTLPSIRTLRRLFKLPKD